MVELALLRTKASLDVAQAFAISELSKRHAAKLIDTREGFDFVIAAIALDAPAKGVHRQVLHHLREDETVCVHMPRPRA